MWKLAPLNRLSITTLLWQPIESDNASYHYSTTLIYMYTLMRVPKVKFDLWVWPMMILSGEEEAWIEIIVEDRLSLGQAPLFSSKKHRDCLFTWKKNTQTQRFFLYCWTHTQDLWWLLSTVRSVTFSFMHLLNSPFSSLTVEKHNIIHDQLHFKINCDQFC